MMKLRLSAIAFLITIAITPTTHAETIKCKFYTDFWWQTNGNFYQCNVENTEIFSGHRVTVDSVEGQHEGLNSNDNVQAFYLRDAPNLNHFPANLTSVFNSLQLIFIRDSKLEEITSDDLKPFPQLFYLRLMGCEIEVIRNDLFTNNPLLEVVDLENNRIAHVDRMALSGLGKLRVLDLTRNLCDFEKADTLNGVFSVVREIELGKCDGNENQLINELKSEVLRLTGRLEDKNDEIEKIVNENRNNLARIHLLNEKIRVMALKLNECKPLTENVNFWPYHG